MQLDLCCDLVSARIFLVEFLITNIIDVSSLTADRLILFMVVPCKG
jgi:hypothetical protein